MQLSQLKAEAAAGQTYYGDWYPLPPHYCARVWAFAPLALVSAGRLLSMLSRAVCDLCGKALYSGKGPH